MKRVNIATYIKRVCSTLGGGFTSYQYKQGGGNETSKYL